MFNFIYHIKETFCYEDWKDTIKTHLLSYQINDNMIINDIINILIGLICCIEIFYIPSFMMKIIVVISTFLLFHFILHMIDALIIYYIYPYQQKRKYNNLKLLHKYLNQLYKEKELLINKHGKYSHMYYKELSYYRKKLDNEINLAKQYIAINEQKEKEKIESKIKYEKENKYYNEIDKKNIEHINKILILLKEQQCPNQFEIYINNIIQLSENIFLKIKDNPNLIKLTMKTYDIYINELCSILQSINCLEEHEQELYYHELSNIIKKITDHLYSLKQDINHYQEKNISLLIKVLDEELSLENKKKKEGIKDEQTN